MNHVFLIQAHKDPELLYKIIERLDASNHYFFIHIDKRSREMFNSCYVSEINSKKNCFIYSEYAVNWGSEKQIWVTLFLLEKSIYYDVHFTYYHFISGQDFPLKGNKDFDSYFSMKCGSSFMGLIDTTDIDKRYMVYHFDRIVNPRGNILCRIFHKLCSLFVHFQILLYKNGITIRPTLEYKLYKGSSWWSFHHEIASYINKFVKESPGFLKRFNYTSCCDEVFFHVIVMNSPYAKTIINDSLRYVDWSDSSRGYPCVLDERDFEKIMKSNSLFCRKIDFNKSNKLINRIEALIIEDNDTFK